MTDHAVNAAFSELVGNFLREVSEMQKKRSAAKAAGAFDFLRNKADLPRQIGSSTLSVRKFLIRIFFSAAAAAVIVTAVAAAIVVSA